MTPARPRIAASIVTYHTPLDELDKCIGSLLASGCVDRVDVVDNGSQEQIRHRCESYGDKVCYFANDNTGFGAGQNISLRRSLEAGTPYHLVINSDVYFEPEVLPALVAYMEEHPDVGQLIPHTVYPDGRHQSVCHPLPSPFDLIIRRFVPKSLFRRRRDRYNMLDVDMSQPRNVPYHHGCFMLLRTEALRRSGLFDERFFMYPEDIDLTRRIHRHYKTLYYPHATIVHAHHADSYKSLRMMRIHAVNMLKYFAKWGFLFDGERRRLNRRLWQQFK